MLLSKANLTISKAASPDTTLPQLNCLHIAEDGSTVACDRFGALACSPVPSSIYSPIPPEKQTSPSAVGIGMRLDFVDQLIKLLPKGPKNAPMQFAAITKINNQTIEVSIADKLTTQVVSSTPVSIPYPKWKDIFKNVWVHIKKFLALDQDKRQVCFRRKQLIQMLQILDEASGDKSAEGLVFIDVAGGWNPISMRCENAETGQRLVAILRPVCLNAGEWLGMDLWERKVLGILPEPDQTETPHKTLKPMPKKKKVGK